MDKNSSVVGNYMIPDRPKEVKSSWVFKDEEMLKKSRWVKGFLATD